PIRRLPEYASAEYYHPLFLYESLWNLLNAGLLIYFGRRFRSWLKHGDLFFIYIIFYAVGRFSLEFLRLDPSPVAGINANQTLMVIVGIGAAAALFVRHRFTPAAVEPMDGTAAVLAEKDSSDYLSNVDSSEENQDNPPEESDPDRPSE
ncbi:MAG: prolipoprotein diacylglyceryl transferase, partial [Anaerolineaceae bacterium]|nr:prolipoprotein diacylglyceryl transferase [Anaerolineaceae bacterium]